MEKEILTVTLWARSGLDSSEGAVPLMVALLGLVLRARALDLY